MNTVPAPSSVSTTPTALRLFPASGTPLAQVIGDPDHRESFHKKLQSMNKYVVVLYRIGVLPLFGAGKTTLLLTTRGRKSGERNLRRTRSACMAGTRTAIASTPPIFRR